MNLTTNIINLVNSQSYVLVSTIDGKGYIHSVAKGVVNITPGGAVSIIDLYKKDTYNNLKKNSLISVTVVDEPKFMGYTLKGKAKIIEKDSLDQNLLAQWEKKVIERISRRLITSVQKDKVGSHHPEAALRGLPPGRDRQKGDRPPERQAFTQGRPRQVLWRRHHQEEEIARKAEGGEKEDETDRQDLLAPGGFPRLSQVRR